MKDIRKESGDQPQQIISVSSGSDLSVSKGRAGESEDQVHQNGSHLAAHTETALDLLRRSDPEGMHGAGELVPRTQSYTALENDFHAHHQTNCARRHGPYKAYRLVYRYGYDLARDPRHRNAEWSNVEREACPRWEERNPGTWEEFKDIIRYAWDTTCGRG